MNNSKKWAVAFLSAALVASMLMGCGKKAVIGFKKQR